MSDGFYVAPLSKKSILAKVRTFREALKMKENLYFNVVAVIELLHDVNLLEFNIVEDYELKDAYAYYDPKSNSLYVRNSVYERAYCGDGRSRFTLAHELAHWFLHGEQAVLARSLSGDFPIYCNSEWQANTFASMLLMDPDLIKTLSIKQIVDQCEVSYQAASIAKKSS